jgi:hypothetical protein
MNTSSNPSKTNEAMTSGIALTPQDFGRPLLAQVNNRQRRLTSRRISTSRPSKRISYYFRTVKSPSPRDSKGSDHWAATRGAVEAMPEFIEGSLGFSDTSNGRIGTRACAGIATWVPRSTGTNDNRFRPVGNNRRLQLWR